MTNTFLKYIKQIKTTHIQKLTNQQKITHNKSDSASLVIQCKLRKHLSPQGQDRKAEITH